MIRVSVCKCYKELSKGSKPNCANCGVYIGVRCDDDEVALRNETELDEFVSLMEHDSFERGPKGIRQIGWS